MDSIKQDRRRWVIWHSVSIVVHVIGVVLFLFSLIYQDVHFSPKNDPQLRNASTGRLFAGRWKYLTYWDHLLQTCTFLICLLVDVIQLASRRGYKVMVGDAISISEEEQQGTTSATTSRRKSLFERLRIIRDTICQSLAFPLGIFVMLLFWGLHTIDKELVLPKKGQHSPAWLNHIQHTAVGIMILVEHVVTHHRRPDWQYGVLILSFVIVVYCIWIHYIGFVQNYWVYPILERLIWWQRILFICGCICMLMVLYWIGSLLYKYWWTRSRRRFFERGVNDLPTMIRLQENKLSLN